VGEPLKYANKVPYNFVLDYLTGVDIVIKPMFGFYGLYTGGKLVLALIKREKPLIRREKEPLQKGVYIATVVGHVESLRNEFPAADFEMLKEGKIWIFVSETLAEFEEYVVRACEMISAGDRRIGR
jgi:hypothetical protein